MRHVYAIFFVALSIIIAIPTTTYGALTVSFGGKIYLAPIRGVTCTGSGTSTITSENVGGALKVVDGISGGGNAGNIISGLHSMLPVYATDSKKIPRKGKQILGRKKLIPSFSVCKVGEFPLPVLKTTNNYNVSK